LIVTPAFTPLLAFPSDCTPPENDTLPPVLAPSEYVGRGVDVSVPM